YFNDFSANNNYARILFKPSVAVQARELTQIQDVLQNQVEQFANWAFQNGDIVSGCAIKDISTLPYTHLNDFASNGTANSVAFDVTTFVNCIATSANTNLSARI